MKSFFTSSLDNIAPPTPYVNAMDWDAYRSQFRAKQNGKSGNRNSVLALSSLNPDSADVSGALSDGQNFPLIIQNTPKTISNLETHVLSATEVDACFGSADCAFLGETPVSATKKGEKDGSDWLSEDSFDLELGLLESVQDVAMALVRTTPKRTVPSN